jgi:CIC family chloride channel protein
MNLREVLNFHSRVFGKRTYLILTSIAIGVLTTLCAALLKKGVMLLEHAIEFIAFEKEFQFMILIFPTFGILLTVLFWKAMKVKSERRGMTAILYSISRKSSYVEKHKLFSQMISSLFTVGLGGSAGLEAPIATTGSAIGSNIARWLKFTYKERTLLLACGAAAGISAVFNAPIAGVVFALEILLVDMPIPVVIPLLISSATAAVISRYIYLGQPFVLITDSWNSDHLFYYLFFACGAALLSVYCIRIYFFTDRLFLKLDNRFFKVFIGGLLLGLFIFLFPPLYGEGYKSVVSLLHNQSELLLKNNFLFTTDSAWQLILFMLCLAFVKTIATALTVSAGGNGGMFGSSLFTGAMFGFLFARTINVLGLAELNEINFTVIGMAALLSGILHAPLTAIFLIAEITGGYALFVPLMIVSSLTFLMTRYLEPFSVYTRQLALGGDLISLNKDKLVLAKMQLRNYLETDFILIKDDAYLADLIDAISKSKRNIFPVVDQSGVFLGIILLDNLKSVMFNQNMYHKVPVMDLMTAPPVILDVNDSMTDVLAKFEEYNAWNLPVTENEKYKGFVSKSKIFTHYRQYLIKDADVPM